MNHLRGARLHFILLACLLLSGCAPQKGRIETPNFSPRADEASPPERLHDPQKLLEASSATTLAQAPDGRLFFTELDGNLKVRERSGQVRTVSEFSVSTDGERGLLGLALHPKFPNPPYIYVFVSPKKNKSISEVRRVVAGDGHTSESSMILELPAGNGCCHKGGRLSFGPDGKLYISVGDNQVPEASQDKNDLRGKILRYNEDGSVPDDGPFGRNPVWATGLRNPFGMRFGPDGTLWATDNGPSGNDGPSCCDELNRIERGSDYGWPKTFGSKDSTSVWVSSEGPPVPTGVAVTTEGVVFCTFRLRRMLIYRDGLISEGPEGCMFDVIQGSDSIYFASESAIYKA